MCVWEQITRPRCQTKTEKGPLLFIWVLTLVQTSQWTTTQKSQQQTAYEKDIQMLNSPSWRPALAVNYSFLWHHGCVSPVPVRKKAGYEFMGRVSVSYYLRMMMNAGGHLSLSHALITPTHHRADCLPTIQREHLDSSHLKCNVMRLCITQVIVLY